MNLIFLLFSPRNEKDAIPADVETLREVRNTDAVVPFVVEPGFKAPTANPRFLVAFGTSTATITSTTLSTTTLTAICQSTTGFQLCGSSGK